MKNPIDLVYVLGSGSKWNNNELRISLRSVEKNLTGIGNVYVVGEKPDYLQNVIHIPAGDIFDPAVNADGNMAFKILRACEEKDLTDDFLFMNDDFIINETMAVSEIPWLQKGDMANHPDKFWQMEFYRKRLRRTFEVLKERNLPTIQYDYHAPMLMNKNEFPKVMGQFDYKEDIGYTFRSLYGNCLELPAIPVLGKKITIYENYKVSLLCEKTKNIAFVGYNDRGLNGAFKWWLIDAFPEKSKYEKNHPDDRIFDLYFWEKNGCRYADGVSVFRKYYHHKNLLRMFEMGETEVMRKKLNFKLNMSLKEILQ